MDHCTHSETWSDNAIDDLHVSSLRSVNSAGNALSTGCPITPGQIQSCKRSRSYLLYRSYSGACFVPRNASHESLSDAASYILRVVCAASLPINCCRPACGKLSCPSTIARALAQTLIGSEGTRHVRIYRRPGMSLTLLMLCNK